MFRLILGLFFLTSCSLGVIKEGGNKKYTYDVSRNYALSELEELAPELVTTLRREPPVGKLDELFGKDQKPLKRVGIIIFESTIQPTRDGLAGADLVYLSAAGKQLMTERLLQVWEEVFKLRATDLKYIPVMNVIKSKSPALYGLDGEDHINSGRFILAPDDIYYETKGKKTSPVTVVSPRGMRDLSFLLIPATELMRGPKWSEHNKHYVNDLMRELNLDAALLIMSEISWTVSRMDKNSGEHTPEEIRLRLQTDVVTSLSDYHQRLQKLKIKERPSVTINFRSYETDLRIPATIEVPEDKRSFSSIEQNILNPVFKVYRDLALMFVYAINGDVKKTH